MPSRTGVNILPQTAVTLAKNVKNIVAIKEASGNISQVAELAALADGCIDIYSGMMIRLFRFCHLAVWVLSPFYQM